MKQIYTWNEKEIQQFINDYGLSITPTSSTTTLTTTDSFFFFFKKQHKKSIHHHQIDVSSFSSMDKKILTMIISLWIQHKGTYFHHSIPSCGFHHFLDGTIIESWMHTIYQTLIQPLEKVDDDDDDNKYLSIADVSLSNIDVYTRIQFQKIEKDINPFFYNSATTTNSNNNNNNNENYRHQQHHPKTFLNFLLSQGPLNQVVNMNGLYYFSVIEEYIAKNVDYPYPEVDTSFFSLIEPPKMDHDPTGVQYDEFKHWFEFNIVPKGMLSKQVHHEVESSYQFHKENHWSYHRKIFSTSDLGINVIGWHGGLFGLGIQATKLYLAAQASDIWTNAIPLKPLLLSDSGPKYLHPDNIGYNLTRSCSEAVNLVLVNADHTRNAQQVIPELIWRFKYTIGYFEWELDVFPKQMMSLITEYDEIWVSTTFIAKSIMSTPGYTNIPIKIVPIPLSFDHKSSLQALDSGKPEKSSLVYKLMESLPEDSFVFLVVFDYWSCPERKNPEGAIRAFFDAFPLESDQNKRHHLIIKSQNGTPIQLETLQNMTRHDLRIHLLSYLLSPDELDTLQSRADCYVSLHRSEGFGMNIMEEVGRGIPVIATNYSGNVDFMNELEDYIGKCVFPVPYQLVDINETIGAFEAGNHWADPDHTFAVDAMRIVTTNECKKTYGEKMSQQALELFGVEAVGRKMKEALVESFERIRSKQESFLENRRQMT